MVSDAVIRGMMRDLNEMRTRLDRVQAFEPVYDWKDYTVSWSCVTGGAPSVGNGTLVGRYWRVGNVVTAVIQLTWGTTTGGGGGKWRFSLPVTASDNIYEVGVSIANDASPSVGYVGNCQVVVGVLNATGYNTAGYDASTPITWASGDRLQLMITYKAA